MSAQYRSIVLEYHCEKGQPFVGVGKDRLRQFLEEKTLQKIVLQQIQRHFERISPFVFVLAEGVREAVALNLLLFYDTEEESRRLRPLRLGTHQNLTAPHLINVRNS